MIHGGGHVMLSRKDVRPKQVKLLLQKGLLPVSIDYRLCPEVNILEGPMTDVCDAFRWAREQLPSATLKHTGGFAIDGSQVVVVGWSTGGHLATTLAWTAPLRKLRPPEAILAFYCPLDYEDDCKLYPFHRFFFFFSFIAHLGGLLANKNPFWIHRLENTQFPRKLRILRFPTRGQTP